MKIQYIQSPSQTKFYPKVSPCDYVFGLIFPVVARAGITLSKCAGHPAAPATFSGRFQLFLLFPALRLLSGRPQRQ